MSLLSFLLTTLCIYSLKPHIYHIAHLHPFLHVPLHTQVDMSDVTSANFTRNKATFAGGAIFADEASTTISSNEYTHALAQRRFGRCFLMFGNEFNLQSVSELPISPLYILYPSTIPSPSFLTPVLLVSLSLSPFFLSPPLNFFSSPPFPPPFLPPPPHSPPLHPPPYIQTRTCK